MRHKNFPSFFAFLICCILLTVASFYVKKWKEPWSMALISWDVSGYYMYLPAICYDNLGLLENKQYIIDTYHPCEDFLNEYLSPIGKYVIKYSCGMAILYLPGFLIGHMYAKFGNYPVDGFSYPYQFSMAIYSLLISFIGLWVSRKLLLKYFSEIATALTILSITLATNYFNYAGINSMFSHNYLFTVYALLIYVTVQWQEKFDYTRTVLIGLLCGLAALIRPTEVISVFIPLFWNVGSLPELKSRMSVLLAQHKKIILLFTTSICVGFIQLLYWKIYAGKFIYWSYGSDDELNFLKVNVWNGLFSYRKGWFAYTPFMILSFVGFITLYRQRKNLFWATFIFTFMALYIVFSWKNWTYGGSFSMRAVIQYYAFLIFPIASFFQYAIKRWLTAVPTMAFLIFCIWLNLLMTYQANCAGIMESDNMSPAYYWKIFGRLNINPSDKKFIETEEEIPKKHISYLARVAYQDFSKDFPQDSSKYRDFEGRKVFAFNKQTEFLPENKIDVSSRKNSWFRASYEIYIDQWATNYWKQPMIYARLLDDTLNEIKKESYRISRIAVYQKWDTIFVDIKVPGDSKGRYLDFGIYSPGNESRIFVRSMKVESTNK